MNRVAKFEKVSFKQFGADFEALLGEMDINAATAFEQIKLPKRATAGSAGYDLITPVSFVLKPGESIRIPTGLRIKMEPGWMLIIVPKSGLGSKFRFQLDNTIGIIDADYYGSANEGHIMVPMTNDSRSGKVLELQAGKAFAQAIIIPFGITEDDTAEGVRTGGFGSTGA